MASFLENSLYSRVLSCDLKKAIVTSREIYLFVASPIGRKYGTTGDHLRSD